MSTASLWFVTDAEFDAATEDYAVVEASVPWVRHALREDNHYLEDDCFFHDDCDDEDLKLTYKDVINNVFYYGNSLGLGADTQLLYADVDQSDEKHRDIGKRVAKEGFLEEETETSKEAREKLIDYIVHMYHSKHEKLSLIHI